MSCQHGQGRIGCVDKYEVSVWSQPPDAQGNPRGIQFGVATDDYRCSDNGNNCSRLNSGRRIFAASVPGQIPSQFITWFQAQQACANVGKRLLRNGEWQMAAAGTPDPRTDNGTTNCNVTSQPGSDPVPTGSRSRCVSNFGVFDMVGNLWEWVEDWEQDNDDIDAGSTSTTPLYGNDFVEGVDEAFPEADRFPAAIIRGGAFFAGPGAGVFAFAAVHSPSDVPVNIGFRCAADR